ARERYDGKRRNPWNEIECGGHYARAMSSWSLLLGLSGFRQDGPRGLLGFDPVFKPERFKSFFCVSTGWGSYRQDRPAPGRQRSDRHARSGRVPISVLELGLPTGATGTPRVTLAGRPVPLSARVEPGRLRMTLARPVTVDEGETLAVDVVR